MANWFLGRALAEEAEAKNAAWSFLGEGVTFWVTVAVLLVGERLAKELKKVA